MTTDQPHDEPAGIRAPYSDVQGRCPACGSTSLFLGDGGYLTCALIDCPDPDAATTLLERDVRASPAPGAPTELGTPAAILTVTVHAAPADAESRAQAIGDLVRAEFGHETRLEVEVGKAGADADLRDRYASCPDWEAAAFEAALPVGPAPKAPQSGDDAPAFTWAESVASHGVGPTATVDIDINAPGYDEPVPVEIPLAKARELYAHLGGVLAEHGDGQTAAACHCGLGTRQQCATEPWGCAHERHTPGDSGTDAPSLRDRIATELHAAGGPFINTDAETLADAVVAVVQPELDRLAADQERYEEEIVGDFNQQATNLAGRAGQAEAALATARATTQRLNYRAQAAESRLNAVAVAVAAWEIGERGTYVPLRTLNAIAKAVGSEHDTTRWELHYQRVGALEAALTLSRQGAAEREALLTEARDALEAAGQPGAHGDDWPAVAPGIRVLAALVERAEAELSGLEETAADRYQNSLHWQERAEEAEAQVAAVRALHRPVESGSPCIPDHGVPAWCPGCVDVCSTCRDKHGRQVPYSCDTATALADPPAGGQDAGADQPETEA